MTGPVWLVLFGMSGFGLQRIIRSWRSVEAT
jgi:hypothetical protein